MSLKQKLKIGCILIVDSNGIWEFLSSEVCEFREEQRLSL